MTKKRKTRDPAEIPLMPVGYQPSVGEKEEEIDMPGADDETISRAFFDVDVGRDEEPSG